MYAARQNKEKVSRRIEKIMNTQQLRSIKQHSIESLQMKTLWNNPNEKHQSQGLNNVEFSNKMTFRTGFNETAETILKGPHQYIQQYYKGKLCNYTFCPNNLIISYYENDGTATVTHYGPFGKNTTTQL